MSNAASGARVKSDLFSVMSEKMGMMNKGCGRYVDTLIESGHYPILWEIQFGDDRYELNLKANI